MMFPSSIKPILLALIFFAGIVCQQTNALTPKEAAPDTPWDELEAVLGSPDILTDPTASEWQEQCFEPFINDPFQEDYEVTNYRLLNQSSGVCMNQAVCIFPECNLPGSDFEDYFAVTLDPTQDAALIDAFENRFNATHLPARVLHPRSASDIVLAIRFCQQHNVGVTVKVAGHSYFGASTGPGTLLIKMSTNYPIYSLNGSLIECANLTTTLEDPPSANAMACAVATARNRQAVMRVGGGELFDHAYRAVFFEWNEANPDRMYHLVGGGAGTVSAAGGWLASGGLSGNTGMRQFGLGVDQVTHMEMVLPSGTHVRFGPSMWEEAEGFAVPRTTAVSGYCNANPLDPDETNWDWTTCEEDINFDDLWFAARGGGGGTFGVVTSVHYQLNDYPGPLQGVSVSAASIPQLDGFDWGPDNVQSFVLTETYVEFVLKFFFKSSDLNVTEAESNTCSEPSSGSLNIFTGSTIFFCYGGGMTMVSKWQEYVASDTVVEKMVQAGISEEIIGAFGGLLAFIGEVPSYAHWIVSDGSGGVPAGRLPDSSPKGVAYFPPYDGASTHFPLTSLREDLEVMAQMLTFDVLSDVQGISIYTLGGVLPYSHDQTTAISPTRRSAGILKPVLNVTLRSAFYDMFYGNGDGTPFVGDDFPGSSCHNHATVFEMGPLKSDWTKACPPEWPQTERAEQCISQNEAAWGTTNLARLEAIKSVIDPNGLFICTSGVGYTSPFLAMPEPTTAPPASEPSAALPETTTAPPASEPSAPLPETTVSEESAAFFCESVVWSFYGSVVVFVFAII